MSDTMIAQVAQAILEEMQNIGYGVGTINAGQLSDALGRAAIKAMREPTEKMLDAGGWAIAQRNGDMTPEAEALAQIAWPTMIDAALARS